MLEYQRVGELIGGETDRQLLLPGNRPLSYLRVSSSPRGSVGLTRALLEQGASEFRLRIPLVIDGEDERRRVSEALERLSISAVYPVLEGRCLERDRKVHILWLDWIQLKAVGIESGAGFRKRPGAVAVAGLEISPVYESATEEEELERDWQYWNSRWEFAAAPSERTGWWRVRPNEIRNHPKKFLSRLRRPEPGLGPQARGTFAACLHPEMRKKLGNPRYVVIQHPFRKGWLPVRVLEDRFGGKKGGEDLWGDTVFLDRTARDALGIADGEFCCVHPWLYPRRSVGWLALRDRVVGARMIAAHTRAPARADLEKPVCRLEPAALEAIGGRPGDFVTLEHVAPPKGSDPSNRWQRIRISQRVLPIDAAERLERSTWEAPQLWDDASNPSPATGQPEAPELEGYVDCAERLAVHPPYPTIYLNYYTRRYGLKRLGLCQPVQVRVGVPSRLAAEASEFVWLAVIALLGAAIAFLESTPLRVVAGALLVLATVSLLIFRAIRAIR